MIVDNRSNVTLQECAGQLAFRMGWPARIPRGFKIASARPTTAMADAIIIHFKALDGRAEFEVAQRRRWLPLGDELVTARVPFSRVTLRNGAAAFVMHGRFGGEPIDHSFWMTRQAVLFEHRDLVIELRETRLNGLGLPRLLRYAAEFLN